MLWVGLVLWIILGSVMLAVRDTIDGQLQFVSTTIGRDAKGHSFRKTHVDFVHISTGETSRCRDVLDGPELPSGSWDTIPGSYETVTTDCWVHKPSIQLMVIIGAAITASAFFLSFFITFVMTYITRHKQPNHPPPLPPSQPQRSRRSSAPPMPMTAITIQRPEVERHNEIVSRTSLSSALSELQIGFSQHGPKLFSV